MKKEDKDTEQNKVLQEVTPYLGLGLQLAITITAMALLGVWLDGKFDISPILTISLSFFGIFAGMYNFIKSVTKSEK
ncbi:MAG: AtpZ/AtpI family protein [Ignavibacteriaceae bacterium]|nr:AtpZ/AtpI family protein [Ignavibacteriaceae bacterium]